MAEKKIKSRKLRENHSKIKNDSVKLNSVVNRKEVKTKSLDQILDRVENSRERALKRKEQLIQLEKIKGIKTRKIRVKSFNTQEVVEDQQLENEDNLSITVMILILIICFIVGVILGYMLYRIAINSSNTLLIIRSLSAIKSKIT